ncbi:MAG: dephospho-CoA kinase [Gammaproteobacteria bacterium]|nr:dephospho-CoA kinase [Gammaproteobacteria bacterium]
MDALIVGLTGGIASGKSLIAGGFERRGAAVLDADQVAREVVAPGTPGLAAVLAAFGERYRADGGGLDRRRLRQAVFGDAAARRRLESILHPLIRDRVAVWRHSVRARYALYSAALLLESGMRGQVDRVLVIDVPEELQLGRLIARDAIDEPLARAMIAAQATRWQRLAAADDVIHNHAPAETTETQIERLHQLYLRGARR